MKKLIIYLLLLPLIFLVSCSKEDLKPKRFLLKDITYTNNATNLPEYTQKYEYDTQGKIASSSSYGYDSTGVETLYYKFTYEYAAGQIIEKYYEYYDGNGLVYITTMNLGSNGFVTNEEVVDFTGAYVENRIYTYNSEGFLVKKEVNLTDGNIINTFEVLNGNTIKDNSTETYNSGFSSTDNYDNLFDPNLSNPFSNVNLIVKKGFPEVTFGFYGRPNKNFVTNINNQYSSSNSNSNDSYKLKYFIDCNGNIEKMIYTIIDDSGIFEYYDVKINYTTIN
jgi:hypothetical protein